MCIELFKWKAHKEEITSIRHVSKRNVFVTAARETSLQLMMWTITGSKIGILGASRWSEDELAAKVERCLKELEHGVEGSNNASGGSSMTGSRGSTPGGLVKIGTVAAMHVKKGGRLKGAAKKVHAGIQVRLHLLFDMDACSLFVDGWQHKWLAFCLVIRKEA